MNPIAAKLGELSMTTGYVFENGQPYRKKLDTQSIEAVLRALSDSEYSVLPQKTAANHGAPSPRRTGVHSRRKAR